MQGQRGRLQKGRAFLARGIGELVAAQRREVHADAAEHAEGAVEAVAGIALGEQLRDIDAAFVAQRRLDRIAAADDGGAIGLREIELLELRVHLDERCTHPLLEGFSPAGHLRTSSPLEGAALIVMGRVPIKFS